MPVAENVLVTLAVLTYITVSCSSCRFSGSEYSKSDAWPLVSARESTMILNGSPICFYQNIILLCQAHHGAVRSWQPLSNSRYTSGKSGVFWGQQRCYRSGNVSDSIAIRSHEVIDAHAKSACLSHRGSKGSANATCRPAVHFYKDEGKSWQ